eukprot:355035-Chlamydomonas_euryale.AAC.2
MARRGCGGATRPRLLSTALVVAARDPAQKPRCGACGARARIAARPRVGLCARRAAADALAAGHWRGKAQRVVSQASASLPPLPVAPPDQIHVTARPRCCRRRGSRVPLRRCRSAATVPRAWSLPPPVSSARVDAPAPPPLLPSPC